MSINEASIHELQRISVTNRYVSRNWNIEHSTRFVVDLDGNILESSHFQHLKDKTYVKDVVELPTSYGCAVRCKHCASALIESPKLLSNRQIIELCHWTAERALLTSSSSFLITFSGIGEGALLGSRLFDAAAEIYSHFKCATFTFTTVGVDSEFVALADTAATVLPTRYLQISFLHHVDSIVHSVIPTARNFKYSSQKLLNSIKATSAIRVRLNIVIIESFNSSREIWAEWILFLDPVKEKIVIRVSALNETEATMKFGLKPSSHNTCIALVATLLEAGYEAYFFASTHNDNLNCGQLVWKYQNKTSSRLPPSEA